MENKFKKLLIILILTGLFSTLAPDFALAKTKEEFMARFKELSQEEQQKKKIEIECQKNPDACLMEPLVIDENGTVEGVEKASLQPEETPLFENFSQRIKQALASLGLAIENGIVKLKELVAEKIIVKKAQIEDLEISNKIQIRDQATGEIYCTWIENGKWVKVKGECQNKNIQQTTDNEQPTTGGGSGNSQPATPTPKVSLTASTSTCATDTEITFTATTSNFATTTLTYAWNFGDSATTTATSADTDSITHIYNATGTYTVSVTATAGTQTAGTSTTVEITTPDVKENPTSGVGETCASSTLEYCTTTAACTGVGGNWYNNTCNATACVPNWQCTDWQSTSTAETTACGETFTQTRTCTDLNNCGDDSTKPAEIKEATGNGDAGITSCDASKNLVGECQNSCVDGQIQTCTPTCTCAQGYFDCNGDGTGSDADGCEFQLETATSTCP